MGSNVDREEDDDLEFTETKPRRSELSPPAHSLASLTLATLDVISHHTT